MTTNLNAADGRALRQTEPLIKPEMLDRLLKPGPKLAQNVRYVKAEMERYADRLKIEKSNSELAERVNLLIYSTLFILNFTV